LISHCLGQKREFSSDLDIKFATASCPAFQLGDCIEQIFISFFNFPYQEVVHFRLWLCRKIYIMTAIVGLLWVAYRYQDFNKINHCMLLEIQQQIKDLKVLQAMDHNVKAITDGTSIQMTTTLAASQPWWVTVNSIFF
jgi:hypothetical protein